MSLSAALDSAMAQIPGCLFAGFAELGSGLMLAARPAGALSETQTDNLAALAVVLFETAPIRSIGEALAVSGKKRADPAEPLYGETLALSGGRLHLFLRLPDQPGHVACFVSDHRDDPAKVLEAARQELATLARAKIAP